MKTEDIVNAIPELDAADLGEVLLTAIERLGQLGRDGRLAFEPLLSGTLNPDLEEGLGQLTEIDAVKNLV
jgi:hypothetical protein